MSRHQVNDKLFFHSILYTDFVKCQNTLFAVVDSPYAFNYNDEQINILQGGKDA